MIALVKIKCRIGDVYVAELAYTTQVNNKTDVYTFGVVALEVIMGRHPGDLISSLSSSSASASASASSSSSSSSSVRAVADSLLLKDVIDQRLPPPIDQMSEKVVFAVKLAFACQHVNPQCRPNMRQVSQVLSIKKPPLQKPFPIIMLRELFQG